MENGSKYDRILEAALHVFAAKGYHEARISEVARAAGVADGTIYLYFKNKDDLLISLFEHHLEAINRGLRAELEKHRDARARLEHSIRYHLALARDNPTLTQFITIEIRRSAKFMKDYAKDQLHAYLDQFGEAVEQGKIEGVFRQDTRTGMFKQALFGALDNICVTWVNNPNRQSEDLDAAAEFLVEHTLRALTPATAQS